MPPIYIVLTVILVLVLFGNIAEAGLISNGYRYGTMGFGASGLLLIILVVLAITGRL